MAVEQKVEELDVKVGSLEDAIYNLSEQITAFQTALTSTSEVNIQNLPYTIGSGHNMFGYTGSNGIDITEAFLAATGNNAQSLEIISRISICKDQTGQFWIPNVFNQLGSMVNGTGYYLYNEGDPFVVTWI